MTGVDDAFDNFGRDGSSVRIGKYADGYLAEFVLYGRVIAAGEGRTVLSAMRRLNDRFRNTQPAIYRMGGRVLRQHESTQRALGVRHVKR